MDRSIDFKLIAVTYTVDDIGQSIEQETSRTVLGEYQPITRLEWTSAGQNGLNPELEIDMFTYDYNGEKIVEFQGNRYSVYRTFRRDDTIELYLERKVGV